MKEELLTLLRRKSGHKFNARQLARHLNLANAQYKTLRQELKDLVSEGKIIVDREQRYSLRDESRVLKGTIRIHPDGFGFFIPDDRAKNDAFIPARQLNFAMNGDSVLAETVRSPRDGRYEGRIMQILARVQKLVTGVLMHSGERHTVRLNDRRAGVDEIYIPRKSLSGATHGDFVAAHIVQYPGPGIMAMGEVTQVIGAEADARTLKEAALMRHGITKPFPAAVHQETGCLPEEIPDEAPRGRVDLRELPIVTIDGITAKDFDDAVCAAKRGRGYVLWVSIADVAEYVRVGSALDKEAYRRGTSTYLPDECVPMLPEKLSNGLCSLNPFVPRCTLTAEIHYNGNMDFTHALFYRSLIKSHRRTTYDEVQAYYDGTGEHDIPVPVKKSLDIMKGMAETLMRRAEERGTLGFDLPEPEVIFDGKGQVNTIRKRQRFFSHKLIEQFMIAANVAVAQFFTSRGLPQLYRVHDAPDPAKVQGFMQTLHDADLGRLIHGFHPGDFFRELAGHPLENFLQSVFLRSLKQAVYAPENIGHYGLALQDYAHFTSPIRRYPDLIVHRQLRSILDQAPQGVARLEKRDLASKPKQGFRTVYSYGDLAAIGNAASRRERESMEAEREVMDLTRAFFMKSHVHEKFFGVVSRVTKFGMFVTLEPHFVDGFLPLSEIKDDYYVYDERRLRFVGRRHKRTIAIGDRLHVLVHEIDTERMETRLQPVAAFSGTVSVVAKRSKKKKRRKQ